jgi:hypothetical protein
VSKCLCNVSSHHVDSSVDEGETDMSVTHMGRVRMRVSSDAGWSPRGVEMLPAPAGAAGECPPRPYPPEELLPGRGWEPLGRLAMPAQG